MPDGIDAMGSEWGQLALTSIREMVSYQSADDEVLGRVSTRVLLQATAEICPPEEEQEHNHNDSTGKTLETVSDNDPARHCLVVCASEL